MEQQSNVFEELNTQIKLLKEKILTTSDLQKSMLEIAKIQLFVMATIHNNMQELNTKIETHEHIKDKPDVLIKTYQS